MADTSEKFVRDSTKEQQWISDPAHKAEAAAKNMTPEKYLESRGGINADGYWADSFIEGYTGKSPEEQAQFILDKGLENKVQQDQNGTWLGATSAAGTIARVDATAAKSFLKKNYPTDTIDIINRLNELSKKSRTGTVGVAVDPNEIGRQYIGKLTSQEVAEFEFLNSKVNDLIKSGAPIYGIPQPDGTTKLSYTNPNAAEEEAYRKANAPDVSLAKAGITPYQGGKILNWDQKQQAMQYVEELRSEYNSLSYAEKQKFDAVQRNLYASILVNEDNPNPAGEKATDIFDNNITSLQGSMFKQPASTGAVDTTKDNATVTTSNLVTDINKILPPGVTVTSTYIDPKTGDTVGVLSNGTTKVLSAGDTLQTNRVSTMNTLIDRFNKYGLSTLANKIKELAIDGATESTITLQLQETPEYQQRFSANAARIKQGLQVLNPAEYLSLEDGYRQVLRAYGLKAFDTDAYVQQFIANDVSAAELSNRVVTAVQRVQNADPAVQQQLRDYYGIGQQDLVAYVLDPQQQFQKIERQVAASEIGVAAGRQGLKPGVAVAEQLAAQGVTQAEAQKGYATIADILPTAEKLSSIYGKTMDTYGQSEAEQEVFNSLASAQRKREKLTARELASFSGAAGTNKTSLTTSSVGQF